jgi:predicted NBD/HSP70 family sugar kinase
MVDGGEGDGGEDGGAFKAEPDDLIGTLRDAFAGGNREVADTLRQRLRLFASALLDVVNVTAPDAVVFSGSLFRAYPDPRGELLSVIRERFDDTGFITHFANTELIYRDVGPEIAAVGSAYRLIDRDWGYIREERRPRRRGENPTGRGGTMGGNA